jgi:ketosteroid isomerase-like protein
MRFNNNHLASARVAATAALLLGCSGCVPPAGESGAEALASIAEFNRRYLEAINSGDIDALAALTTEGHLMISSGGPPMVGKEALVNAMSGAFERFDFEEYWTPEETYASGDLAFQRGTFIVNATPKSGSTSASTSGNFLRIYRRQPDGRWLMVIDNFNSLPQ